MMIIDCHTHIANEIDPVWGPDIASGEQLVEHMNGPFIINGKKYKVDKALIMPSTGLSVTGTFDKLHEYSVKCVHKFPDRLHGIMMINPRWGVKEACKTLERLVDEERFVAAKLHPNMHRYFPSDEKLTHPIMKKCEELEIPVLIHSGDPIHCEPSRIEPLISAFPEVRVILCHMGCGGWINYDADVVGVAKRNDNCYIETSWGFLYHLRAAIRELGADKFVFGTDTPPTEMGCEIRHIEVMTWDPPFGVSLRESDMWKILGGNLQKIVKL